GGLAIHPAGPGADRVLVRNRACPGSAPHACCSTLRPPIDTTSNCILVPAPAMNTHSRTTAPMQAMTPNHGSSHRRHRLTMPAFIITLLAALCLTPAAWAASEANLVVPDLSSQQFFGLSGSTLLTIGIGVCIAGLVFGLIIYIQLKNMPVHESMREISELIYETCKTYLITQGKFLLLLWAFIAVIMAWYFGWLASHEDAVTGEIHYGMP